MDYNYYIVQVLYKTNMHWLCSTACTLHYNMYGSWKLTQQIKK